VNGYENTNIKEIGTKKIRLLKLDEFVNKEKIAKIDLIKIDVDGVEKEVIEGGADTFKNKIDNAIIEISPLRKGVHSSDYIDVFKYMHEAGFTFVGLV